MGIRDIDKRFVHEIDTRLYSGVPDNWDNDMFRELVLKRLRPEHSLLDVGAGRGALPQMDFQGLAARIVGIDPAEAVLGNPYLDEAYVATGESMPQLEDSSFDVVVCNNVLEHLPDAPAFFREVARVMKPGGRLITKTPNMNHYMPLIARATPTSFHEKVTAWRGRPVEDTFPTTYPANTKRTQTELASAAGLRVTHFESVESRPEYLRMSSPLYAFGVAYERLVNLVGADWAKIVIFTEFTR